MRVLWLTNFILPHICEKLELPGSNKEGWVVGMSNALRAHKEENGIELGVIASIPQNMTEGCYGDFDGVTFYGFHEKSPELYEPSLEKLLFKFAKDFKPDVIHIFGTEFPHTRAMVDGLEKYGNRKNKLTPYRILIGIQGVMLECTEHYLDGIPAEVAKIKTFRDLIKGDGMLDQKAKFKQRTVNELAALENVGHVTGRTPFDEEFCKKNAFLAKYHFMNETLRSAYYENEYKKEEATPHEIFVCQGDYPLKGMHFVIRALPKILEKYPDTHVYVAGDAITREGGFKEKIKLPGYGKYLLSLEKEVEKITGKKCPVTFVGRLSGEEMLKRYLSAEVFLCPSTVENSSNSVGEAMLLGLPVVAANVGGIPGILEDGKEGLLYEAGNVDALAEAVDKLFGDSVLCELLTENAKRRALNDHDPERNYRRLIEIYNEVCADERFHTCPER